MNKFLLLICSVMIFSSTFAQINYVPNPSFEDYNSCPSSISGFDFYSDYTVDEWLAGTSGTSDYFNSCASAATQVSVPENLFSEDQPAHTGEGYGGFWTYFYYDAGLSSYREYVQVKLTESLIAGECYYVEFWCAPATQSDVGSDNHATTDAVGAYFSEGMASDGGGYGVLDLVPQVENNGSGNYIDPPGDWTLICGFFEAEGGEDYICIGNFHDEDIEVIDYTGGDAGSSQVVYLFVDDVRVAPLDSIVASFLNDTVVCAPITLSALMCDGVSYIWSTGETTPEITVYESGDYWVSLNTTCGSIADTATVTFVLDSIYTSETEFNICFTDIPFDLNASPTYDFYNWSTGETSETISISESGTYYVNGFTDCANFVDSFIVNVIEPLDIDLDLGNDTLICENEWDIILDAPEGDFIYLWNTGETTNSITVNEEGSYSIILTSECETFEDEIIILEDPNLNVAIDLGPDLELCPPAGINTFILSAPLGLPNYLWSTGETTQSIQISNAGIYSIVSELPCKTISDEVLVVLCNDIYVPNAFSPNEDGVNDLFLPIIVDPSRLISFNIYNRWGEQVFSGNASLYAWDGKFQDGAQPLGVYVYEITLKDDNGLQQIIKGNLTLVK